MKSTPVKKICIVTQSHLCRNPRVVKEAIALANKGFQVIIINNTYSSALNLEDRLLVDHKNIRTLSIARLENANFSSFIYRLIKKSGDWLTRYFRFQTPYALGYGSWRYYTVALEQKADLYICHQEIGLYCGVRLLGAKKKVSFDLEDWYSEDLLEEARKYRPVKLLKKLEGVALRDGVFCMTTSDAMARKLAETYQANTPQTVYNTFASDEVILTKEKVFTPPLTLFWFSQTIGPGRGIEAFLGLIGKINLELEVHLLGNVDEAYKNELLLVQDAHPLLFHNLVPANKLAEKIACFDVGLALEETRPTNRNLTITNKLFQYIQSGLPVIATATLGQLEIFDIQDPGFMIEDYNRPDLAQKLKKWLESTEELNKSRQNAVRLARTYNQDTEYAKLLKLTANALQL